MVSHHGITIMVIISYREGELWNVGMNLRLSIKRKLADIKFTCGVVRSTWHPEYCTIMVNDTSKLILYHRLMIN